MVLVAGAVCGLAGSSLTLQVERTPAWKVRARRVHVRVCVRAWCPSVRVCVWGGAGVERTPAWKVPVCACACAACACACTCARACACACVCVRVRVRARARVRVLESVWGSFLRSFVCCGCERVRACD